MIKTVDGGLKLEKKYWIKCDDCRIEIGETDSLRESAEGGRCAGCEKKAIPMRSMRDLDKVMGW